MALYQTDVEERTLKQRGQDFNWETSSKFKSRSCWSFRQSFWFVLVTFLFLLISVYELKVLVQVARKIQMLVPIWIHWFSPLLPSTPLQHPQPFIFIILLVKPHTALYILCPINIIFALITHQWRDSNGQSASWIKKSYSNKMGLIT